MSYMDDFAEAVEIIPGRFYLAALKRPDAVSRSATAAASLCYCIDHDLIYEPFYADFGPLNLGRTYRFCEITSRMLKEGEKRGRRVYLYCGTQPQQRANAAVLVGAFQVMLLGRTADEAYKPLAAMEPFMPFRDASCGAPCFNLQVIDCLRGLQKAAEVGFLDASHGVWRFDIDEYEHYEQVENGDLNWIVPGKLVAFSGPAARPTDYVGFRAMVPEDYWDYYHRRKVTAVVRLNKKVYDRKRFLDGGLRHHELYFPDGSCPPTELLLRFLEIAEQEPGALAIHCKAGLGRTGVLICSYIMKHYGFTAEEVIGYIRICRPGSVIGPQQNYIREIQSMMWREGDAWRARAAAAGAPMSPPATAWGPAAPSRAGSMQLVMIDDALAGVPAAPQKGSAVPMQLVVDATGDAAAAAAAKAAAPAAAGISATRPSAGSSTGSSAAAPSTLQGLLSVLGSVGSSPLASALMLGRPGAAQGIASALRSAGGATNIAPVAASTAAAPAQQRGGVSSSSAGGVTAAPRQEAAAGGAPATDFLSAWRAAGGAADSSVAAARGSLAAAVAAAAPRAQQSNIVRVLAPNGQPRKVPLSALQAAGTAATATDSAGGAAAGGIGAYGSNATSANAPRRSGY